MGKRTRGELPEGWLNKQFHFFTVKKLLYDRLDEHDKIIDFFVECLCVCGKLHPVNSRMLQKQKVKSCGCQKGLILSQYRVKESGKEGLNPLYFKRLAQYKTDCKQFNTEWGLTDAKAIDMFQLPCTYCGRILYSETYIQGVNIEFPCNGLDKVDPTGGYTNDNVVTACDDCNTAKTNLPLETFLAWRQRIVNNHDKIVKLVQSKIDQK